MHFLEEMSKIFELHMVTFGERNYAHTIANLMDPHRKYFHDRILSRNEIFNPVSKTDNLKYGEILNRKLKTLGSFFTRLFCAR
jgi:RNA polymerase II subunit A-like phosphatase